MSLKKKIFHIDFNAEKVQFQFLNGIILIYLINSTLFIYNSNDHLFFEIITRKSFIVYYILLIIFIFFPNKNLKFSVITLCTLFLDLPFVIKQNIQEFFIKLNFTNSIYVIHIIEFFVFIGLIILGIKLIKGNRIKILLFFLITYYLISLIVTITSIEKTPLDYNSHTKTKVTNIRKNYYILLFDEYPSVTVSDHYIAKNIHMDKELSKGGFQKVEKSFSNFSNTELSTLSIFSGQLPEKADINKTINSLYNNLFTQNKNYSFVEYSIFDNENRPNSTVQTQFFQGFNNFSTRYIIPFIYYLFSEKGIGNFTDYAKYNERGLSRLNQISSQNNKHIFYIHYYTPHYYPLVEFDSFEERMIDANKIMRKSIEVILKNDPLSGIIILSDHGLRSHGVPPSLHNKNILYYKNVELNQKLIEDKGIYKLFSAIKF